MFDGRVVIPSGWGRVGERAGTVVWSCRPCRCVCGTQTNR